MRAGVAALAVCATLLLMAAPGVPGDSTDADADVDVTNFAFTPEDVTIDIGEQVTWHFLEGFHGIETADASATWCPVQSSGTCSKTFLAAGTYDYRCSAHPTSMLGSVTVLSEPVGLTVSGPQDGDVVGDSVSYAGTATHASGISTVSLSVNGNATTIDAGGASPYSFSISRSTLAEFDGPLTLMLRADAVDGTTAHIGANVLHKTAGAVHDLAVTNIDGATGTFGSTTILVDVTNQGSVGVSGITIRVEYEYQGEWFRIGQRQASVAAGATTTGSFVWQDTDAIGAFNVRATVLLPGGLDDHGPADNVGFGTASFWTDLVPGTNAADPL